MTYKMTNQAVSLHDSSIEDSFRKPVKANINPYIKHTNMAYIKTDNNFKKYSALYKFGILNCFGRFG